MIPTIRWIASILFFFLGLTKAMLIRQHGLTAYRELIEMLEWPISLQYYGVLAAIIEIYTAISLWVKKLFTSGLLLMVSLTMLGVCLSLYSLIFKLNSDCGCGLLGDDEYGLLTQKLLILILLFALYKEKKHLF